MNNGARLCASARLCRGSPVDYLIRFWSSFFVTLNFQGQIWNLLYIGQNGPIATKKSKYIDWILRLICDHWIWPWPWPWPWIFKVKYGICYISTKNGPVSVKQKANISIELYASNVTTDWTLAVTLTLNFQGQIGNLLHLRQKWSDYHKIIKRKHRLNWRLQWPSSLTLAMTSKHSHLVLFDGVTRPLSCSLSSLLFRDNLSYIHVYEREGGQRVKQGHHTSVPRDCALKGEV